MMLAVAIPCGLLSAAAYGAATAVQHSVVHTGAQRVDARGLLRLVRNPRWLLSVAGDGVGFALQLVALLTGPVVLIQPLLVLAVPASLVVGHALGGPRPRRGDYLACLAIIGGLGVFYLILGDPGAGRPPGARPIALATLFALVVGGGVCGLVTRGSPTLRAAVYGAVAGGWFGLVGVLLDATSSTWAAGGIAALWHPDGWAPLAGLAVTGAVAVILTQASFQVGPLRASYPANESAAPVVAVLLGAVLLHEAVPASAPALFAYLGCVVAIVAGTIRLATDRGSVSRPGAI